MRLATLRQFVTPRRVAGVLLALGVVLRLRDYLVCRSLWLDEAMLARNLVDRPIAGLLRPLDHNQGAPVGFLLVQKLTILLLGPSEWSLRLVPLALGVWSLFLFAGLVRRLVGPTAALAGLALFALAPALAMASSKQYGVDVWSALVLLTLTLRLMERGYRRADYALLAGAGAGLIWVSHPAPVMLASAGSVLVLTHVASRQWANAVAAMTAAGGWLASFAWNYLACTRHLHANSYLAAYWQDGFPPSGATAPEHLAWLGQALLGSLEPHVKGQRFLACALLTLGAAGLRRSPRRLGLLALPVLVSLALAAAGLLPFLGRLILFLVPFYYMLIAAGLDALLQARGRLPRGAGLAALLVLLWQPGLDVRRQLFRPLRWEETRDALAYISGRARPGDVLFVHPNATHTFAFYERFYPMRGLHVVRALPQEAGEALQQLRGLPDGARVWVLHSEMRDAACPIAPLARQQVLDALAARRDRLDGCVAPGVTADLFSPSRDGAEPVSERPDAAMTQLFVDAP